MEYMEEIKNLEESEEALEKLLNECREHSLMQAEACSKIRGHFTKKADKAFIEKAFKPSMDYVDARLNSSSSSLKDLFKRLENFIS